MDCDNTVLVFAFNESARFYGYGRVESLPTDDFASHFFSALERRSMGPCFRLRWLNTQTLAAERTAEFLNRTNLVFSLHGKADLV